MTRRFSVVFILMLTTAFAGSMLGCDSGNNDGAELLAAMSEAIAGS